MNLKTIIMKFIMEGNAQFMIPLVILLLLTLFLVVKSFKTNSEKNKDLIKSVSLLALVFGFFALFISLFHMFTMMGISNRMSHNALGAGLMYEIIPTLLGIIIFLTGRLGLITLTWTNKE